MSEAIKRPGFQKGHKLSGSRKGIPNKTTVQLKEAILAAGEAVGSDGKGKGGMGGYLKNLASAYPPVYATLLGKVLPLTVAGDPDQPIRHVIEWQSPSE